MCVREVGSHGGADGVRFLLELGRDLHEAGASAHRLEEAMGAIAERMGIEAQVFSTPTSLFVAVGPIGDQQTHMMRVESGEPDLERLVRVDRVIQLVATGAMSASAGVRELNSIPTPSGRWGR